MVSFYVRTYGVLCPGLASPYGVSPENDPRKQDANRFSANMLIPPSHEHELAWLKSYADVRRFAESIGIAAGIVVGRLQREEIIPYRNLNKLKVRLEWGAT